MTEKKATRLSKIARELNVGISTIVEFLHKKGHSIEANPNTKLNPDLIELLVQEYSSDSDVKKRSERFSIKNLRDKRDSVTIEDLDDQKEEKKEEELLIKDTSSTISSGSISSTQETEVTESSPSNEKEEAIVEKKPTPDLKVVGKVDLDSIAGKKKQADTTPPVKEKEEMTEEVSVDKKEPEKKAEEEPEKEPEKEAEVQKKKDSAPETRKKAEEKTEVVPESKKEEPVVSPEQEKKDSTPVNDEKEDEIIDFPRVKTTGPKVVGKIDLEPKKKKTAPEKKAEKKPEKTAPSETETPKEEIVKAPVKKEDKKAKTPVKEKETEDKQAKVTTSVSSEDQSVSEGQDTLKKDRKESAEKPAATEKTNKKEGEDENLIPTVVKKLAGPTVVGKIELPKKPAKKKPVASSRDTEKAAADRKKKRKRIKKDTERVDLKRDKKPQPKKDTRSPKKKKKLHKPEVNEEEVQKQIKDTLAKLTAKGKSKGSKHRREKRDTIHQRMQAELEKQAEEKNVIKVTEFVSVSELANMMSVPVNKVIQTCMNLGLFVSINQRLDAETLALVADEFNYKVEFISADLHDTFEEEEEEEGNLKHRSPIVTVMGHVDHGKTKLLDYIRSENVIAGEAGGITQHIGAYSVELEDKRNITFLDTPGHEAFTAMRARGAQITDVAIIVVAADDGVMPQTVEAINHASAAGVPIVFAINKIDKPTSNPDKIKEELAAMNYLVEDWGGKYQSQDISAKSGLGIEDLLEKVLLEAELLELQANPDKRANGTVIESTLDRGRGYVATILVQTGTLHIGDVMLAGSHFGHVKAMYNERGVRVEEAGPSSPVLILGLNGAPQAGDRFNIMENDREAKDYATKREQLQREQELRTQKHITLDEIGRRIAIGNFKELNLIVKGDVDGSVEALSDSLLKLSTEEIQVNIKHKAVGQITETDILLAAASNAIVLGFQVRPSLAARKIAEREQIDIRLYSIIYDAIEEIKAAMEGMLSPEIKEEITATLDVLEAFKITKVGTIAGCMVKEGKIRRDSKVRVIREGIVVYTGELGSLKRFKDDAKEVVTGLECGLNIENFNDIKVGDVIEAYNEFEVKKTL